MAWQFASGDPDYPMPALCQCLLPAAQPADANQRAHVMQCLVSCYYSCHCSGNAHEKTRQDHGADDAPLWDCAFVACRDVCSYAENTK